VDVRATAAADLERLIRAHEPDDAGHCISCKASGEFVIYPCTSRLICERAAVTLARRRARTGGTAFEQSFPSRGCGS
jgi:hypothetical protein